MSLSITHSKEWLNYYTSFAVFLFPALALVVDSGYSYGPALLLLGGLWIVVKKSSWQTLQPASWRIVWLFIIFALSFVLEGLVYDYSLREYDLSVRFIAAILVLVLLLRYPPKADYFWGGLVIGSMLNFIYAFDVRVLQGLSRGELGHTQVIQFGNIALLIGVLALAGIGWAREKKWRKTWLAVLIFAGIAGILTSLLSGTRGGWVALPFALIILYRGLSLNFKWRHILIGGLVSSITVLALYFSSILGVKDRVDIAVQEVRQYYQENRVNSSVGARLEMWYGTLLIGAENPFIGVGNVGYKAEQKILVSQGQLDSFILQFNHPHNQYLDRFVKFGLLGLIALLALLLVPAKLFFQLFNHPCITVRSYATAGAVLIVSYIDFNLTQAFFAHNSGVMFFAFMLVIIWSLLQLELKKFSDRGKRL